MRKRTSLILIMILVISSLSACKKKETITAFNGVNEEFAKQEAQEYKVYYKDEQQAVELVKSFFEDWFKYRNVEKAEDGSFLYSDYKIQNNSSAGFTYDSDSFRNKYAWSGESNLSNLYGANVLESDSPSDTLSSLSEFVNVKVLWTKDNIMHVGVILTFNGKSNIIGDTEIKEATYYGIVEVIKEEVEVSNLSEETVSEVLKVKSVDTLSPLVRTSAKQASNEEIDAFIRLMNGEGASMFEIAFKESALLEKYAEEGMLTKQSDMTDEDITYSISDYYATNEYFKAVALKNYELKKSGVDINTTYNLSDGRTFSNKLADTFSDLVSIEYTPEKANNSKDVFGSLTIGNDVRVCLFDSEYLGKSYEDIEATENEELLGITTDTLNIEGELYSKFDSDRGLEVINAPSTTGVLKYNNYDALVIKNGYVLTSLEAYKNSVDVLIESGLQTSDGTTVGYLGLVTYNNTLGIAILKINDDSIEPTILSNDFKYIWSENEYGISKSLRCEVGTSRTQVYLPLVGESQVVYNEEGNVVCLVVDRPDCTLYDVRGVGANVVSTYTELLDSITGDIGYIEKPMLGGESE